MSVGKSATRAVAIYPRDLNVSTIRLKIMAKKLKLFRLRRFVQIIALPLWLWPLAAVQGIPACVFHCYACPLSSFACPIGLIASAVAVGLVPLMALGVIFAVGALIGSAVCGWLCPFGLLQDLLHKIPTPKFHLPAWTGVFRYVTLVGLVFLGPILWGKTAGNYAFICNVCPAGALEAGLPRIISGEITPDRLLAAKYIIAGVIVILMLFTYRPWCRVLCPLGGMLALFNRVSVFFLRFRKDKCANCKVCTVNCPVDIDVKKAINTTSCIRCLKCTSCRAVSPTTVFGKSDD